MRSMTGYGRGAAESERFRIEVALRSVNHRFLDLVVRLREPYRSLESEVRSRLGERLGRGRVEAVVEVTNLVRDVLSARLDRELAASMARELSSLEEIGVAPTPLEARDLVAISELWSIERRSTSSMAVMESEAGALLIDALDLALEELVRARDEEGRSLEASLRESLGELEELVARLCSQRESVRRALLEGVRKRIGELVDAGGVEGVELDRTRLEQEAVILAERSDVSEELDRLAGHVEHFSKALGSEGPVGRRLDFLAQEMARELNTVAAKCRDLEMAKGVIDGKLYCERLREQAANVE